MMKKKAVYIGAAVLSLALAGCGSSSEKSLLDINPDKYVTLGDYKGVEAVLESIDVSESDIEEAVNNALKSVAEKKEVTGRPVKEGDIVNIDYEGKKDGVAFEGGTAQGFDLTIGSNSFIDGFEDGLIGANTGDTLDLNLTFPEGYRNNPELSGQPVVFTVSVNSIQEEIIPELTDETAAKIDSTVSTVEEYKENVKERLYTNNQQNAQNNILNSVFNTAYENAEVKEVPDWLLQQKVDMLKQTAQQYASNYNIELSEFLENYMGQTEEEFDEECQTYGKEAAQQSLIMCAIAKAEGLTLSSEERKEALSYYTKLFGYPSEEELAKDPTFDEYVLKERVVKFLLKNASVKDADGNAVDAAEYLNINYEDSWKGTSAPQDTEE